DQQESVNGLNYMLRNHREGEILGADSGDRIFYQKPWQYRSWMDIFTGRDKVGVFRVTDYLKEKAADVRMGERQMGTGELIATSLANTETKAGRQKITDLLSDLSDTKTVAISGAAPAKNGPLGADEFFVTPSNVAKSNLELKE